MKGNKIVFPNMWADSGLSKSLTANIKLVAPYGHPKGIKEFIVKPLLYLLILSSARTSDGITYGRPSQLSLNAYGLGHTRLATISNIQLTRGSNSSHWNHYCQPLVVDVNISFEYLITKFAVFDGDERNPTSGKNIFDTCLTDANSRNAYDKTGLSLINTLQEVVQSFRPFGYNNDNSKKNSQGTNLNSIGEGGKILNDTLSKSVTKSDYVKPHTNIDTRTLAYSASNSSNFERNSWTKTNE